MGLDVVMSQTIQNDTLKVRTLGSISSALLKHKSSDTSNVIRARMKRGSPSGHTVCVYIIMLICTNIRGPFEKFVDSPYYSESELRDSGAYPASYPMDTTGYLPGSKEARA
jgi:hypothetical protein